MNTVNGLVPSNATGKGKTRNTETKATLKLEITRTLNAKTLTEAPRLRF